MLDGDLTSDQHFIKSSENDEHFDIYVGGGGDDVDYDDGYGCSSPFYSSLILSNVTNSKQ